jgi:hypothetical protein
MVCPSAVDVVGECGSSNAVEVNVVVERREGTISMVPGRVHGHGRASPGRWS